MRGERGGNFLPIVAVAGLGLYGLGVMNGTFGLPDFLKGGSSDKSPQGQVIYQGQQATTVSDVFPYFIGGGEGYVAAQAKQNYDEKGGIFSGDFVPTNGTAHLRDPNKGGPANVQLDMKYCANGYVEVSRTGEGNQARIDKIVFHVGELMVCDATVANNEYNNSAWWNDGTPDDFFGKFQTFTRGAVEATAKAAPCPDKEFGNYTGADFAAHAKQVWAAKFADQGATPDMVEVVSGTPGRSSDAEQKELTRTLDSYANFVDPNDPTKTYPAINISFMGSQTAVEDSCFLDLKGVPLQDIEGLSMKDIQK